MTETQRKTLRIPSREEFHRYTSNLLTEWDFCTDFPPMGHVNKTAKAINWSQKNAIGFNTYNHKFKK